MPVSLSVSNLMSATTMFVEFALKSVYECIYKKLSCKRKFRENRFGDSSTLLKDVNEFIPVLPIFCE
jgi:hypothetical protein